MYICHCKAVTDRTIDAAIASGARTVKDVADRCRAGSGCGGCRSALEELLVSAARSWEASADVSSPAA